MTAITVSPFVMKDVTLQVDVDNYEAHVSQVELQPTTSTQTWKGLTPEAVFTDQSAPTWAFLLAFAQDWSTPNSLSQYLFDHIGEVKAVTFVPDVNSGQGTWTADVVIGPGAVGGTVDGFAVATVTLGVQGKPTFAPFVGP